jgi:glycosyltransferase involved in cell wall biosynthesis
VAVVAKNICSALSEAGWNVARLSPSFSSEGYLTSSLRRLGFNIFLRHGRAGRRSLENGPVVAFDFDGFYFPRNMRFASVNGGLLGDIVRFEKGAVRQTLKLLARLDKMACRKAEVVFTPSAYCRKRLDGLYGIRPEKVRLMPNGIFFESWVKQVETAAPEPRTGQVVLAVARLYKRKGLSQLIKVWPEILRSKPGAVLNIIGDGLEMENLQNLARELGLRDSVKFIGDVRSGKTLAGYYAGCDVFCLPSLHETFGLVFLEAMAAGKPVVALNCTAVPEVVRDGVDGILAPPGDDKALFSAVVSLLENESLSREMGERGKRRVGENFDWSKVIRPLVEWLEKSRKEVPC